jgi:Flp pilus assembly protein protease CpaA
MNNLDVHIQVAMWFFRAALAVSAIFAIYVFVSKQSKFSRWTSIPAASISVITFIFLFVLEPVGAGENPLVLTVDRPAFWSNALLEWGIFFSIMIWVLAASLNLYSQTKKAK